MTPLRTILAILTCTASLTLADTAPYDDAPIHYSTTRPVDPATRLQSRLDDGSATLDSTSPANLLRSVLTALNVPVSSQTLVFSRTSLQRTLISPSNPRALYFNDDTYVGYVPGGRVVEIATTDPHLGSTFYTIDQHPRSAAHVIRQTDNCLECHATNMTHDLPGLIIRSVFPDSTGEPILPAGTFLTTHESPISQRWGGWYITGSLPGASMANTLFDDTDPSNPKPLPALDPTREFNTSLFPTPYSDPVALLVLEHQVEAHNRLSRALYASEQALHDEEAINRELDRHIPAGTHSDSTISRIHHACDPLVEYLLFSNEAPLHGPISGPTSFASDFSKRGPRDPLGRSLRDLDLRTRLFKYPCSYLIYSPSFDSLPTPALEYVYQRLYDVLTDADDSKSFDNLSANDRQAILEILRATKPNLPAYWAH
ncbi:MAG TPA: hypothetical protein VFE58_13425 [Tepidisphaeraceae bacterium]|jgi:hypothetical protein|nr:hypothetical protein [Tepidisphaeraceae bacterium]